MKAKVFISWSGERSKVFADILRSWLPKVVHVNPFFSQSDIRKGSNWYNDIVGELKQTKVGIFCITGDNDLAPWLLFEAGAISVGLARPKVCPLLFGISAAALRGPLLTFQAAEFSKSEMMKIVEVLNEEVGEEGHDHITLKEVFEQWWPTLEKRVLQVLRKSGKAAPEPTRSEREMLEEILLRMRAVDYQEKEFKGRMFSNLGYLVGEMGREPRKLVPKDKERLAEAIVHCQMGYDQLKQIGGAPEFMALNNLVYYSAILNEGGNVGVLLAQARRLIEAGKQHNATNLVLTGCFAIIQFSTDLKERRAAYRRIVALLREPLTRREREEAELYLRSFPELQGRKRRGDDSPPKQA